MKIKSWLNKPYPFVVELKKKLIISFSFGLFIYLFLAFFQPFGIEKIIGNKSFYLLGFGLITTIVMLFNFIVLPLIFPKFFDFYKWNVIKEILFVLLNLLFIVFLNFLYNSIVGYDFAKQHSLIFFIPVTISVGVFPITLLIFITELFLRKSHQKTAYKVTSKIKSEKENELSNSEQLITIQSELKNDNFTINERDLIFIKSEDNYCSVNYLKNDKVRTHLIRISLKNIEQQTSIFSNIIRCHRSYIVNKNKIIEVTGNARAYNLHFANCNEIIPISRKFPKDELFSTN